MDFGFIEGREHRPRFGVTDEDCPGPSGALATARDELPSYGLGENPSPFFRPGEPSIFPHKSGGISLPSADRPPNKRDRHMRSDETRDPVIGISKVMKQVESSAAVKSSGHRRGFDLPNKVIEMLNKGVMPKSPPPDRQPEVMDTEMGGATPFQGKIKAAAIP
jgi:hypothetical protein